MKRLLLAGLLAVGLVAVAMAGQAEAVAKRCGFVIQDSTAAGDDTVFYNKIISQLGHTIKYIDDSQVGTTDTSLIDYFFVTAVGITRANLGTLNAYYKPIVTYDTACDTLGLSQTAAEGFGSGYTYSLTKATHTKFINKLEQDSIRIANGNASHLRMYFAKNTDTLGLLPMFSRKNAAEQSDDNVLTTPTQDSAVMVYCDSGASNYLGTPARRFRGWFGFAGLQSSHFQGKAQTTQNFWRLVLRMCLYAANDTTNTFASKFSHSFYDLNIWWTEAGTNHQNTYNQWMQINTISKPYPTSIVTLKGIKNLNQTNTADFGRNSEIAVWRPANFQYNSSIVFDSGKLILPIMLPNVSGCTGAGLGTKTAGCYDFNCAFYFINDNYAWKTQGLNVSGFGADAADYPNKWYRKATETVSDTLWRAQMAATPFKYLRRVSSADTAGKVDTILIPDSVMTRLASGTYSGIVCAWDSILTSPSDPNCCTEFRWAWDRRSSASSTVDMELVAFFHTSGGGTPVTNPTITISAPNGGETWNVASSYNANATVTGDSVFLRDTVYLSDNNTYSSDDVAIAGATGYTYTAAQWNTNRGSSDVAYSPQSGDVGTKYLIWRAWMRSTASTLTAVDASNASFTIATSSTSIESRARFWFK